MLLDRSNDFLILFMTFWKLIRSCTVTPRWLGNAKECIQSGWSKQRDSCSLANEILAIDAGRFESCISRNYLAVSTWILNISSSINLSVYLVFDLEARRFKFLGENLLGAGRVENHGASLRSILQVEWLIATLILWAPKWIRWSFKRLV